VLLAPVAADLLNLVLDGTGIPVVMGILGLVTLLAGFASWRHNAQAGLHRTQGPAPGVADGDEE
jgi:hypothetical protein